MKASPLRSCLVGEVQVKIKNLGEIEKTNWNWKKTKNYRIVVEMERVAISIAPQY